MKAIGHSGLGSLNDFLASGDEVACRCFIYALTLALRKGLFLIFSASAPSI